MDRNLKQLKGILSVLHSILSDSAEDTLGAVAQWRVAYINTKLGMNGLKNSLHHLAEEVDRAV